MGMKPHGVRAGGSARARRTLLLVMVALTLVVSGVSAKGIGIGVEYVFSYNSLGVLNGFAVTGSPPVLPAVFGLSLSFGHTYFNIGLTADWWLYQRRAGPLGLYVGPGLFAGAYNLGGASRFAFGVRAVVGFEFYLIPPLEFFLEPGLNVGLAIGSQGGALAWGVPMAFGFRFWF